MISNLQVKRQIKTHRQGDYLQGFENIKLKNSVKIADSVYVPSVSDNKGMLKLLILLQKMLQRFKYLSDAVTEQEMKHAIYYNYSCTTYF